MATTPCHTFVTGNTQPGRSLLKKLHLHLKIVRDNFWTIFNYVTFVNNFGKNRFSWTIRISCRPNATFSWFLTALTTFATSTTWTTPRFEVTSGSLPLWSTSMQRNAFEILWGRPGLGTPGASVAGFRETESTAVALFNPASIRAFVCRQRHFLDWNDRVA